MSFVPVKCTSCGGDIQLDDNKESGFCVHCGTKVVFKEAVQKMELSGSVSVKGIADLEKLLQNAETFHALGDSSKEKKILNKVTNEYPEDYRAWWALWKSRKLEDRRFNTTFQSKHPNRPDSSPDRNHFYDLEVGFPRGYLGNSILFAPAELLSEILDVVKLVFKSSEHYNLGQKRFFEEELCLWQKIKEEWDNSNKRMNMFNKSKNVDNWKNFIHNMENEYQIDSLGWLKDILTGKGETFPCHPLVFEGYREIINSIDKFINVNESTLAKIEEAIKLSLLA